MLQRYVYSVYIYIQHFRQISGWRFPYSIFAASILIASWPGGPWRKLPISILLDVLVINAKGSKKNPQMGQRCQSGMILWWFMGMMIVVMVHGLCLTLMIILLSMMMVGVHFDDAILHHGAFVHRCGATWPMAGVALPWNST